MKLPFLLDLHTLALAAKAVHGRSVAARACATGCGTPTCGASLTRVVREIPIPFYLFFHGRKV
jgi:hypothetical protein